MTAVPLEGIKGAGHELLNDRLQRLIDMRTPEWRPADLRTAPWLEISKHLLRNRTSVANTYALLSDDGAALLIDYGYDFTTGLPAGTDRSSRRPWLETIPALKRQFGIDRVEVAIPTHYHDDHVAGLNLLRDVHGLAVAEVAERLGKTQKAVAGLLSRARKELRKIVEQE